MFHTTYTTLPDQRCAIHSNPPDCKHLSTVKEQKLDDVTRSLRQVKPTSSAQLQHRILPAFRSFFPPLSGLLIHLSEVLSLHSNASPPVSINGWTLLGSQFCSGETERLGRNSESWKSFCPRVSYPATQHTYLVLPRAGPLLALRMKSLVQPLYFHSAGSGTPAAHGDSWLRLQSPLKCRVQNSSR